MALTFQLETFIIDISTTTQNSMKYLITLADGITHELDLPVADTISWEDFVNLSQVKSLGLPVFDVTPEGMPDWFTDEERMRRQLSHMGIKKSLKDNGAPLYEEDDE